MFLLALALIARAEPSDARIVVDSRLSSEEAAAWTLYAMKGVLTPGFDGEVQGREAMLDHRAELRAKKKKKLHPRPDPYLDALAAVREAGFLREYVWVYLRQPGWDVPPGLKLEAFTAWKATHLAGHAAETWARVEHPATPPDPEAAAALAADAERAYEAGHPDEAAVLASRALDLDPEQTSALWSRALALLVLIDAAADPDARARLAELANADLNRVVQLDPGSPRAAIVLEAFGPQPGLRLPRVACPAEASAAYQEAEQHFGLRRFDQALAAYDRALELCPGEPTLWVYSGDALHQLSDLRGAVARYDRAIAIAPCHWQAHRFRGDVLMDAEPAQARRSYALALACNPGYETAWKHLGAYRASLSRPTVGPGGPALDRGSAAEGLAEVYDAWLARYTERVRAADPDADFAALKAAVEAYRSARPAGGDRAWDALRRADDAGFLREAMYVHLFGPDLIPAFVPWRDANIHRLVAYLEAQVIAPF